MPAHNVDSNTVDINNSQPTVGADDPLYLEQQIGKNLVSNTENSDANSRASRTVGTSHPTDNITAKGLNISQGDGSTSNKL